MMAGKIKARHLSLLVVAFLLLVQQSVSSYKICPYAKCECTFVKAMNYSHMSCPDFDDQFPTLQTSYDQVNVVFFKKLPSNISKESLPQGIADLTILSFEGESIPDDLFEHSETTLKKLDIWLHDKSQLPAALRNLPALEDLTVESYDLIWDEDIVKSLAKNLTALRVGYSASFKFEFLKYFEKLHTLELNLKDYHNASDLSFPEKVLDSVETLDLVLDYISPKALPKSMGLFSRLKDLTLDKAYLKYINDYGSYFRKSSQSLQKISLEGSPISQDIDISKLESLKRLSCKNCNLYQLPKLKSNSLLSLDLPGNKIASIEKDSLSGLKTLRSLGLDHNKIRFVDDDAFIGSESLLFLNLRNNSVPRVPLAIARAPKLDQLDLTENPIACPCTSKELHDWASKERDFFSTFKLTLPSSCVDGLPTVSVLKTLTYPGYVCSDDILG